MARVSVSGRVLRSSIPWAKCLILLAFSAPVPVSVFGQAPAERLLEFAESARGFTLMRAPYTGVLPAEADLTFSFAVESGVDYMVVGYCEHGCENLDLALVDSAGRELASDRLPDAQPMVPFTSESTEELWISVEMGSCSLESCEFAVGVFWNTGSESNRLEDIGASRMRLFKRELGELGFTQWGEDLGGGLGHTQEAQIPMSLEGGNEYRIGAVCDDDCLDLDLILRGPEGDTIASDILRDAFPVIVHVPAMDGEFDLTVRMAVCFVEPCGFRIAAMSRTHGLGPGGIPVDGRIVSEALRRGTLEFADERLEEFGDERLPDGSLFDAYSIPVKAGQTIIADLRSDEFDTFLAVEAPGGELRINDDYGLETGQSHIEWIAPEDGTYKIVVTTFSFGLSGDYILQIAVAEKDEGTKPDTATAEPPLDVGTPLSISRLLNMGRTRSW